MEYIIDLKKHIAMDTSEYLKKIHNYLNKQDNIDKSDSIEKYLSEIERKYESILKAK